MRSVNLFSREIFAKKISVQRIARSAFDIIGKDDFPIISKKPYLILGMALGYVHPPLPVFFVVLFFNNSYFFLEFNSFLLI